MVSLNGFWQWIISIFLNLLSFLKLYHPPLQYYLPGQIVYYVQSGGDLSQQQIDALITWSNGLAGGAIISFRRVLSFPPASQQLSRTTIIFANVENAGNLVELIKLLDNKKADLPVAGITLNLVAPNWLITDTSHLPGTGGPGSWPIQADPPHTESQNIQIKQGNALIGFSGAAGTGVHVAVLDTAPPQHILDHAYHERHWHHHLIEQMLDPANPRIRVYPATYDDLHESVDFSLLRHHYLMRDHGLFVVGIIHTIAPEATLHLYEVLNPYGVGTIESIAQGLLSILNDNNLRPVVINCSFTLGLPGNGKFDPRSPVYINNPEFAIQQLFELCHRDDVIVVAAAGNDSHRFGSRQPTRYPAAFKNIFGVGALRKASLGANGGVAFYSNMADDKNPGEGYMTLGGEPGVERGIAGVYIDDFPRLSLLWRILDWLFGSAGPDHVKYRRNTTGWAWWAGTSFSAAVLTGTLAALPSRSGNINDLHSFRDAQMALDQIIQTSQTAQGEKILGVEQI